MESSRVFSASRVVESGCSSAVCRHTKLGEIVRRRALLSKLALTVLATAVLADISAAWASNWTLPEDTGTFKFNTSRQVSAESNGRALLDPRSETLGFKPAVAYGVTDSITLGLNNEYSLVKSGLENNRSGGTEGFMSTELFLRGQLRDQDWYRISARDLIRLPGQESSSAFTQAESSLGFQYGRSGRLGSGTWSSSVTTGFQPSLAEAPDKLQTDLTFGWRPVQEWQFTAQSFNTFALNGAGAMAGGTDSSMGQLSVVRYLSRSLSVQLGGWQTVSGEADGAPNGFDAVIWLRY